jgi:hypothetical protein
MQPRAASRQRRVTDQVTFSPNQISIKRADLAQMIIVR